MTRPLPGELYYRSPECPLCGNETECDSDSFNCYRCGCNWSVRGVDEGRWNDPNAPQCVKFLTHGKHPILSGRCILTADHDSEHNNGNTTWSAEQIRNRAALGLGDLAESEVSA